MVSYGLVLLGEFCSLVAMIRLLQSGTVVKVLVATNRPCYHKREISEESV